MSNSKRVVLDTNILLRAIFGIRVRSLLETYEGVVLFYTPDVCFSEAHKHIPAISTKRGVDRALGIAILEQLAFIVEIVDKSLYEEYEASARDRIGHRDVNDWPIVATSLLLNCPVWTEDHDFFGSGVSTWTSQTIELYLRDA